MGYRSTRRTCRGSGQGARPVSRRASRRWSAVGSPAVSRTPRGVARNCGCPRLICARLLSVRPSSTRAVPREQGVYAENVRGEPAAENRGDVPSPIAAVGYELAIAEPSHQFHPCGRDLFGSPPGGGPIESCLEQRAGEGVALPEADSRGACGVAEPGNPVKRAGAVRLFLRPIPTPDRASRAMDR